MNIELRQLSLENDLTEYNMLQDIDANENGFTNEVNGMSFERYKEWLIQQDNGNALFVNVLAKCKLLGYSKIKSFVHVDNVASNKVFINNGAVLLGVLNGIKNIYETAID